ncbi:MAG TPA: alanine racemase C-terminal domain-containing protein, partial [Baekduia sp.]|nr:alanine racemase C-terminal domain-containing protein [Baekduia sp.]
RMPVRGTVSMDNITVEVPAGVRPPVPGDEVVLMGVSGDERVSAEELAQHADTINYEITCGFSTRPRRFWTGA